MFKRIAEILQMHATRVEVHYGIVWLQLQHYELLSPRIVLCISFAYSS